MDYVGQIFRPPSEARSLLLQVTVGCSHNRCSYCAMYRDKTFAAKDWSHIEADISEAQAMGPQFDKLFLCDGDALILSTTRLLRILEAIKARLPWIRRVGTYGDTRSVGKKSLDELKTLKDAGLGIIYHGMESGDDEVMRQIDKGATAEQCVTSAENLRQAGLIHSVIVLLGIGGTDRSAQHAEATARILSDMDPAYVGALTTTVLPGTPLYAAQQADTFCLPSKFQMLTELRTIVAESVFSHCRFSSNHASNYLPLGANLPAERDAVLRVLDEVIASGDESRLKPESWRGL